MSAANGHLDRYRVRGWRTVPVHRPDPETGHCSCGNAACTKPGKHPDPRFWPNGAATDDDYVGRNVGLRLGPDNGGVADVDLDCGEAVLAAPSLLPATGCAFGRGGRETRRVY